MVVETVLREGAAALEVATDAPWLEAELLLSHVTGLPRPALLAHPEHSLPPHQLSSYRATIRRRTAGIPLPYLTGRVEFYGLDLAVTPHVLIPRPETETLVDLALQRRPEMVVDVGSGSGCVAVALAVHLPGARVVATDISAASLQTARANARRHRVQDRVRLVQCDLVAALTGPVDLLVSNPPYVARGEWASLPMSVRQYEPALALDGGPDGLAVIQRLLATGPRILQPGGAMLVEIGAAQGKAATRLAQSILPGARVAIHPDLAGRDRVLEVVLPGRSR